MTDSKNRVLFLALAAIAAPAFAQAPAKTAPAITRTSREITVTIPGPTVPVVDPQTGAAQDLPTSANWHYMCGSDLSNVSEQKLRDIIAKQDALFAPGQPIIVVDTHRDELNTRAGTFNVVFNLAGSVPAAAVQAFTIAEQYLESTFNNPITLTVNVGFASMGSGVIGATGSNYINGVSYATSRTRLIANAASSSDIQNFLPATSTIPVRFNGATTTVTNVNAVNWTIGNAKAAGVTSSGSVAGNMTYNTDFSFDYDPSNGVPGSTLSLVDTIIHETGHAMGFVSAADGTAQVIDTMDLYRFQRTNSTGTWNPTSNATFTTYPRLVSYNSPNDDHIVDLISGEYRMSDGTPYQASHFRQQSPIIGIMEPALANGQTFYPNYFRPADQAVFKAMGWNNAPPCSTTITVQPNPTSYSKIAGEALQLSVGVTTTGTGAVTYQWLKNNTLMSPNNVRFTGTTGPTLVIDPLITSDAGTYVCVITSSCGGGTSDSVSLAVAARCPADLDDGTASGRPDGAITIDDLLFFVTAFEAGSTSADLDNGLGFGIPDGAVTIDDLLYFLSHFEAGC